MFFMKISVQNSGHTELASFSSLFTIYYIKNCGINHESCFNNKDNTHDKDFRNGFWVRFVSNLSFVIHPECFSLTFSH